MAEDADRFVQTATGIAEATSDEEGQVLHTYRGALEDGTAVRILTPAPQQSETVRSAFEQAADAWEAVSDHASVVTVQSRGDSPRPWLAVDELSGESLATAQPRLSHTEVLAVLNDVAGAIREATYYDVVHHDLSPARIDVRQTQDGVAARVDDWGLRRVCHSAAGERPISPYTAPELLDAPDGEGRAAGVYGLGAVTYFALTGQPPIETDGSLESAIRVGDIPAPSTVDPSLPAAVDDVVLRALSADPEDRYESGFVFRKALASALGETPEPGTRRHDDDTAERAEPTASAVVPDGDNADAEPGGGRSGDSPSGEPQSHTSPGATRTASSGGIRASARAVGVAVGIAFLGVVILAVVTAAVGSLVIGIGFSTGVALVLGTVFGQYLGFAGLALTYLRRRGFTREQIRQYLGVRRPTARELGLVVLGQLGIFATLLVLGSIIQLLDLQSAENAGAEAAADAAQTEPLIFVAVVVGMFLVVGPSEELLFRGGVQGRLRERFSPVVAIVATSAVFAPIHVIALAGSNLTAILVTITVLFVTSLALGAVYEYTGNIFVPMLLHGLHNSIVFSIALLGPEEAELLTWTAVVALA
ncbi:MAG: CPBP family glutamic-type intramembrane protease [Halovenus sp.]